MEFASRYRLYSGSYLLVCMGSYSIFCSIAIMFQCVNRNSLVDSYRITKCNACIHTKLITLVKCVSNDMLLLYMLLASLTNVASVHS